MPNVRPVFTTQAETPLRWLLHLIGAVIGLWFVWSAPVLAQSNGFGPSERMTGIATLDNPLDVRVGIFIDQITAVDQKSENYGAVVTIRLEWQDPVLAFDAGELGRDYRLFRPAEFIDHVSNLNSVAPLFVIQNQQSNRWIHQSVVVVYPDGKARYFEKSSLTLQAPYFNFVRFPFDRQNFYFELVSVFPEDLVRLTPVDEMSGLGELLGEEEWILENAVMEISTATGITGQNSAMARLGFEGRRHVMYYGTRIFTPMLVLILVSWATFFLEEYRKRIEVAGANLLVFVGFNWMISDSLPKLGYLTFLDFILQWMFVVTGSIIIFNVGLRWLKINGRETLARSIDNYVVKWIYPLGYLAVVGFAMIRYLYVG
ncbi:hypothetical protein LCL97_16985 [Seohaeicola saemankumensis]|nr:hypothetical protein [Seohaeicola saemankumensis]MCA0872531.1 hypothetical protein [Seohaeicola saemankumensis]